MQHLGDRRDRRQRHLAQGAERAHRLDAGVGVVLGKHVHQRRNGQGAAFTQGHLGVDRFLQLLGTQLDCFFGGHLHLIQSGLGHGADIVVLVVQRCRQQRGNDVEVVLVAPEERFRRRLA